MSRLSREDKRFLDSLDDAELIFLLHCKYGATIPKWEETTKEEYERAIPPSKKEDTLTMSDLMYIIKKQFLYDCYKKEPLFDGRGMGIMDQLNNIKPNGYKYYKKTGEEHTLLLSSGLADYVRKRGL